jgi:hypothetical protein
MSLARRKRKAKSGGGCAGIRRSKKFGQQLPTCGSLQQQQPATATSNADWTKANARTEQRTSK